ncbi:MAG TPA: alpha-amylase family glycosyl hydrolase [Acidimicrobiales bacterium]|nr:alpha-amylase family glycosyl hydrolase [Acidimicrobiales bacterium]
MRRALVVLLVVLLVGARPVEPPAGASDTPPPSTVSVPGSFNTEMGCPGDWQPDCPAARLALDVEDDVWQGTVAVPAGAWEYKAAIDGSWQENYGLGAVAYGPNIPLSVAEPTDVSFYYDHKSHWITDNQRSVIPVAAGSFQRELGCAADWDPGCLRSWLQDIDGDGLYSFQTRAVPAGSYAVKVALAENWTENYGEGGLRNGANIQFEVTADNARVTFRYDSVSHALTVDTGNGQDGSIGWDGLRHDSRDPIYRTPSGAVPAGTPVRLRIRTFHDDATGVELHVHRHHIEDHFQQIPMELAAADIGCYEEALAEETCDFWEVTVPGTAHADHTILYQFLVTDGPEAVYYADDVAVDGGAGRPSRVFFDQHSYAINVYDPAFDTPDWMRDAVIYQVFPDRFRNGDAGNDLATGTPRYDEPVLALPWGTKPEGYCRGYADAPTSCPWRFDDTPPEWSPDIEGARGRDYMGGDLAGIDESLDYLASLGVTALYLNPIFDSGSNHGYDTQDHLRLEPAFGTEAEWAELLQHARERNIRIILDAVFNHMSSDSPFFDRYGRYPTVGACESANSPYRGWFHFRPPREGEFAVCAPSTDGGTDTFYDSWAGFDSIPVLDKSNPEVQRYFLTGPHSVARHWIAGGAGGWRLDVMDDESIPPGYWETFRREVKATNGDAVIIGEVWHKGALHFLRGDSADTVVNYRFGNAVIGLLAPGDFDPEGGSRGDGRPLEPSEFASRLLSIREDYPDAAYRILMNVIGSHDTARTLWTLTPGAETRTDKEENGANVAAGLRNLRLASLIQYTVPGAPTVLYGDEVGLTGDDDPDNRRTYPWESLPDPSLASHYRRLSSLREKNRELIEGDLRVLLADDAVDVVVYGRRSDKAATLVLVNDGDRARTVRVPVSGYLPNGTKLHGAYAVGNRVGPSVRVSDGMFTVPMKPHSGLVLETGATDLAPPAPPAALQLTDAGDGHVDLAWKRTPEAAGYNVYRSALRGGGYERVNDVVIATTTFSGTVLDGRPAHFVVRAVDGRGNESGNSNEVSYAPLE